MVAMKAVNLMMKRCTGTTEIVLDLILGLQSFLRCFGKRSLAQDDIRPLSWFWRQELSAEFPTLVLQKRLIRDTVIDVGEKLSHLLLPIQHCKLPAGSEFVLRILIRLLGSLLPGFLCWPSCELESDLNVYGRVRYIVLLKNLPEHMLLFFMEMVWHCPKGKLLTWTMGGGGGEFGISTPQEERFELFKKFEVFFRARKSYGEWYHAGIENDGGADFCLWASDLVGDVYGIQLPDYQTMTEVQTGYGNQ